MKAVYPLDYPRDLTPEARLRRLPGWWHLAKRLTDITVACAILILTLPVMVLTAAVIAIASPGPPIFSQTRVGKNGRTFKMFKFRTMANGAHLLHERMLPLSEVDGPVLKIRKDPRLHLLGGFLRRTSID